MSIIQEFKRKSVDEKERQRIAAISTNTKPASNFVGIFKDGVYPFKLENGDYSLRLLPQKNSSTFGDFLLFDVLSFFGDSYPLPGTFRVLDTTKTGLLSKVRQALKDHPTFKFALFDKEANPTGLSLGTKPKVAFLAFDINDKNQEVKPLVLPGTLSYPTRDGKARTPGAGTRITQFSYAEDIKGNLKYGDIFDIETGRVITLSISNAKTMMAKYDPAVDIVHSLLEDDFAHVLKQIKGFDAYLKSPTDQELVEFLIPNLPTKAPEYLDSEFGFLSVYKNKEDKTPKKASIVLPEEDEDEDYDPNN